MYLYRIKGKGLLYKKHYMLLQLIEQA